MYVNVLEEAAAAVVDVDESGSGHLFLLLLPIIIVRTAMMSENHASYFTHTIFFFRRI